MSFQYTSIYCGRQLNELIVDMHIAINMNVITFKDFLDQYLFDFLRDYIILMHANADNSHFKKVFSSRAPISEISRLDLAWAHSPHRGLDLRLGFWIVSQLS